MRDRTRGRRPAGLAVLALALGVAPATADATAEAVRPPVIRAVSAAEAQSSAIKAQRASGDTRTVDGTTAFRRSTAVDVGAAEAARVVAAVVPEAGLTLHRRIVVRNDGGYGVTDVYSGPEPGRGAMVLHHVAPGALTATKLYRMDAVADGDVLRATVTGADGSRITATGQVPSPTSQCAAYNSDVCNIVNPGMELIGEAACRGAARIPVYGPFIYPFCKAVNEEAAEMAKEECDVEPGDPYECEYGKAFITLHGCNSGQSCTASGHGVTGVLSVQNDWADLRGTWYYPCLSDPGLLCSASSSEPLWDFEVTGGTFRFSGAVFTDYPHAVCHSELVELDVYFGWTDLSGQVNPPSHQFTTHSERVRTVRVPPVNDPACA